MENKQLSKIDILANIMALHNTYTLKNIILDGGLRGDCPYPIFEPRVYFNYNSMVNNVKCTGQIVLADNHCRILIEIDTRELKKLGHSRPLEDRLYREFNNLASVQCDEIKILLTDDKIIVSAISIFNNLDIKAIFSIAENFRSTIFTLDTILDNINTLKPKDSVYWDFSNKHYPCEVLMDFDTAVQLEDYFHGRILVRRAFYNTKANELEPSNIIKIPYVHDNDTILNLSKNAIEMLREVGTIYLDNNTTLHFNLDTQELFLNLKTPRFIGLNGNYQRIPLNTFKLGEIKNNRLSLSVKQTKEYIGTYIIHLTDVCYEQRRLVIQLSR